MKGKENGNVLETGYSYKRKHSENMKYLRKK